RRIDARDGKPRKDGILSAATMYRFQQFHFPPTEIRDILLAVNDQLVLALLQFPEVIDEADVLMLDSSRIQSRYTAPILDKKTGKIVNENKVTAPELGYVPTSSGLSNTGHGCKLPLLQTTGSTI